MKKYHLATYGCQMNEYDSAMIAQELDMCGCVETSNQEDADFIIVNTCSVREKAEETAIANISKLKASVEKDGCTYYTKDDIIDRLWEHHEGFLTSIDKGMVWMNVSLADVGVNWKKD